MGNRTQAERVFESILTDINAPFEAEKIITYANGTRFALFDFAITDSNGRVFAIEIDGTAHDSQVRYDEERDKFFGAIGISTIRFTNREVLTKTESVKSKIMEMMDAKQPS